MRLIDADDEKLRRKLMGIREAEWQIYGKSSCFRFTTKCIAAIDEAPTVEATPTWIPCSKKLPETHEASPIMKLLGIKEESERVQISVKIGETHVVLIGWLRDGEWFSPDLSLYAAKKMNCEVIAWTPMPKPYEGGGDEGVGPE